MPLFAPEEKVMEVARMEKVESGYGGYQIEMELADPNPETGNPRNWLGIPKSGRVTARTVLGWWLSATGEVEKKIDGLDFRSAPKTKASLANLCKWMTGKWYLWESRKPPGGGFTQEAKERWVPVRKFKSEEEAVAYYNETAVGDLSDDEEDIPLGVPQHVVDAAMPIYVSAGKGAKGAEAIKAIGPTMWPNTVIDELVTVLEEQAS